MSRSVIIHSDGTGHGTVVLDEDGNKLSNIMEANISIEANALVVATLYVQHTQLNIKADVTEVVFVCPACSQSTEHNCDPTFAGDNGPSVLSTSCDSTNVGPHPPTQCIRGLGHDKKHFDGERTWT